MINQTIALFLAALFGLYTSTCFATPEPQSNDEQVITAGIGLSACPIGCDKHQFVSLFSESKNIGSYVHVGNHGIEASVKRGHIAAVFFYFNTNRTRESNTGAPTDLLEKWITWNNSEFGAKSDFNGRTNTGIGADSSINDVIKTYGKPEEYWEGPGPYSKGQEIGLDYSSKGIFFTFIDNRLSDIRVFSPPKAPPALSTKELRERLIGEWQLNLHSGNQGLPFKEGFLTGSFGPVLTLNADETASYTIPCDINEEINTINKKLRLGGQWKLTDDGFFSLPLQLDGIDVSIKGQLLFDEQSDEIDHLVIAQAKDKSTKFGRFSRSLLNCN